MSIQMNELQERVKNLKALIASEEKASDRSQAYIDDLRQTIKSCMVQISYLKKNPFGYEVVNGT